MLGKLLPADTPTPTLTQTGTPTPTQTSAPTSTLTKTPIPTETNTLTQSPTTPPPPVTIVTTPPPITPASHPYTAPQIIANYMPWYNLDTWSTGCTSGSDLPASGPYNSDETTTIERHITEALQAGIDGFAVHWVNIGNRTDNNLKTILKRSPKLSGGAFHSTVTYLGHFFEGPNGQPYSQAKIINDLQYLINQYSTDPSYLTMAGKPVIMFADMDRMITDTEQITTPQIAWAAVRSQVDPDHKTLWIAESPDPTYLTTFDGLYIYKIDHACCPKSFRKAELWADVVRDYEASTGQPRYFVGTIQPGWDDLNSIHCQDERIPSQTFSASRRHGAYYQDTFDAVFPTQPDMIVIHSFNEWVEGSYIEPSENYGDFYLTYTRKLADEFHGSR